MKRITAVLLAVIIIFTLTGCNQDYLQNYKEAVEKTESRESGKERISIKIENEFNEENISQEIIEELNYLKNIQIETNTSFNKNREEVKLYVKYKGLGYDFNIYTKEEEILLQVPMIGKYIKLDESNFFLENENKENQENIQNLGTKIQNEWLQLLKKEDVVKGKRDVMTTKDGDVKVDKYTINPSEEQLRLFLKKFFAILRSEEENLKLLAENQGEEFNIEEMVNNLEKIVGEFEKITFSSEAYIDIDGYIVKEFVNIDLENYDPQPGSNSKISIKVEIENWENEVEQTIEIPKIEEGDLIDLDSMENNFENFIK
jgi:hypothetical protein